jgi:hypothetical protein
MDKPLMDELLEMTASGVNYTADEWTDITNRVQKSVEEDVLREFGLPASMLGTEEANYAFAPAILLRAVGMLGEEIAQIRAIRGLPPLASQS